MKEIFFYMPINDYSAELIMSKINERMDEEIIVRALTPGGNVLATYPICDKFKQHGNIHLKVDSVMSGGAFLPLFAKTSECLDVSRIMFHRADFDVENADEQIYIDGINKDLKALMKKKVDAAKWKEITGITIDQLFDPETRVDVYLTGKQAVEIGLIDKCTKLTPQMQKEITASSEKYFQVAANANQTPSNNSTSETMTKEELQLKFPAVYAAIKVEGKSESKAEVLAEEKERVDGWAHFMDVDAKAVKEGIASGKRISQAQSFELMEKKFGKKEVVAMEEDTKEIPELPTGAKPAKVVTAEDKKKAEKEQFVKDVKAQMSYFAK